MPDPEPATAAPDCRDPEHLDVDSLGHCATCGLPYRLGDVRDRLAAAIPPGTPPPKVTVEVWDGEDQIDATVADVVRINDAWHVVVTVDGT